MVPQMWLCCLRWRQATGAKLKLSAELLMRPELLSVLHHHHATSDAISPPRLVFRRRNLMTSDRQQ